jgi:hypothetical protein
MGRGTGGAETNGKDKKYPPRIVIIQKQKHTTASTMVAAT